METPKSELMNQEIAAIQKEVAEKTLKKLNRVWYKQLPTLVSVINLISAIITIMILIVKLILKC